MLEPARTPFAPAVILNFPIERVVRTGPRDERVFVTHWGETVVYENPTALHRAFREAEALLRPSQPADGDPPPRVDAPHARNSAPPFLGLLTATAIMVAAWAVLVGLWPA